MTFLAKKLNVFKKYLSDIKRSDKETNQKKRLSTRIKQSFKSGFGLFRKGKANQSEVAPATKEHRKKKAEPLVHYNGACDTYDQLPEEKVNWMTKEVAEYEELRHPVLDHPKSLVLRKPQTLGYSQEVPQELSRAKATFYMRVLEVVNQSTTKQCFTRPVVYVDDEIFVGANSTSQRCDNNGTLAHMDETYLIDIDKPKSIYLSVYSEQKTLLGSVNSRFRLPEVCVGAQEFQVAMAPAEKKLARLPLLNTETDEQCQVLVMYGTYFDSRVMTLLYNKMIYQGFITVYTRGKMIPMWVRYWAKLYPTHIELYDFEYKDRRSALYKLSMKTLLHVFHPRTDDDERLVDVGSLGLALQFSSDSLEDNEMMMLSDFECRMYVLPDDYERAHQWEQALLYVISLINEFQHDNSFISKKVFDNKSDDEEYLKQYQDHYTDLHSITIPSKFLW